MDLQNVLAELGYVQPTPIQSAALPFMLLGKKDVVGHAKTGSGKTLAYALPIVMQVQLDAKFPHALVLCPTRELCQQVARVTRSLARKHPGFTVLPLTGGEPIRGQIDSLQRGTHVVVGTPGRILDHIKRNTLQLSNIQTLILDEADRMLDMGFQKDVESIMAELPQKRQTHFFSATFSDAIHEMSKRHQHDVVSVQDPSETDDVNSIDQFFVESNKNNKIETLLLSLNQHCQHSAMVFCNFKSSVAKVTGALKAANVSVGCLHGDLDQFHRDQVLARFRNRSLRILVATDVAGRGIDIAEIGAVINFELPDKPEIYVHRIGRTGRAGQKGVAISMVETKANKKLKDIEAFTGTAIASLEQAIPLTSTSDMSEDAPMRTILISGGRKDKIRPGDVLGALTGDAGGLKGTDIGKIELHDRLTYVAVRKEVSEKAAKGLNAERIKRKRFKATLIK